MSSHCMSKQAFTRGVRPSSQHKIHINLCHRRCTFCEIWKLATLVNTHVSLSTRYSTTPANLQQYSSENYDHVRAEKMIEAGLDKERSRLSSIISICTVEGAMQSEGLQIAYENCLASVKHLLYQEAVLEEALVMTPQNDDTKYAQSYSPQPTRTMQHYYHSHDQRTPGMVSMAA